MVNFQPAPGAASLRRAYSMNDVSTVRAQPLARSASMCELPPRRTWRGSDFLIEPAVDRNSGKREQIASLLECVNEVRSQFDRWVDDGTRRMFDRTAADLSVLDGLLETDPAQAMTRVLQIHESIRAGGSRGPALDRAREQWALMADWLHAELAHHATGQASTGLVDMLVRYREALDTPETLDYRGIPVFLHADKTRTVEESTSLFLQSPEAFFAALPSDDPPITFLPWVQRRSWVDRLKNHIDQLPDGIHRLAAQTSEFIIDGASTRDGTVAGYKTGHTDGLVVSKSGQSVKILVMDSVEGACLTRWQMSPVFGDQNVFLPSAKAQGSEVGCWAIGRQLLRAFKDADWERLEYLEHPYVRLPAEVRAAAAQTRQATEGLTEGQRPGYDNVVVSKMGNYSVQYRSVRMSLDTCRAFTIQYLGYLRNAGRHDDARQLLGRVAGFDPYLADFIANKHPGLMQEPRPAVLPPLDAPAGTRPPGGEEALASTHAAAP